MLSLCQCMHFPCLSRNLASLCPSLCTTLCLAPLCSASLHHSTLVSASLFAASLPGPTLRCLAAWQELGRLEEQREKKREAEAAGGAQAGKEGGGLGGGMLKAAIDTVIGAAGGTGRGEFCCNVTHPEAQPMASAAAIACLACTRQQSAQSLVRQDGKGAEGLTQISIFVSFLLPFLRFFQNWSCASFEILHLTPLAGIQVPTNRSCASSTRNTPGLVIHLCHLPTRPEGNLQLCITDRHSWL